MMDCKQLREVLDLYIDRELAPEALAAASAHLGECAACRQAEQELLRLRGLLKAAVAGDAPSPGLVKSVRALPSVSRRRLKLRLLLSLALLLGVVTLFSIPAVRGGAASTLDRIAFHLDTPRTLVLEGRLICRDCELERMYSARAMCKSRGHHGAIETPDGKIWNLMENEVSDALIHDDSLRGKTVRIVGKVYRRAGCVEVQSFQVL